MQGYKSILVHVTTEDAAAGRIALATDLAERFDAHLIGVGAGFINLPLDAMGDGSAAAMVADLETTDLEAALRAAEQRFLGIPGQDRSRREWRASMDFPVQVLAREARAAELLVLGPAWSGSSSNYTCAAEPGDVVLQAGRPVLLVPPGIRRLDAARVLVAWKDTREARRAVQDALPLLRQAERVQVLNICEGQEDLDSAGASAADVARFLLRQGIGAEGDARRGNVAAAAQLLRAARDWGADLIVSGGYGHARMREWAFGGATRDLLRQRELCCLLNH